MAAARILLAASALALLAAHPLPAQVGGTTDIVMGQVVGPDSTPLPGARVEVVSRETGVTRRASTNSDGRYTVVFPNGGGSYAMSITYLGMAPFTRGVARQGDEDRIVADAAMGHVATRLATVEVVARRVRPQTRFQPPAAGSTERNLPAGSVSRMPVDAGSLNALATLAPGVIGVPGTDSTPASFSVAGQAPDQNSITLDGLSFGSASVPQEAIRGTRVVTSTFDVARGQFTGGQVTSTTRGGTSLFQGSVNYSMRNPSLEFIDNPGGFTRKYRQNQLSLGLGGPLVRDRAFGFGAFQWNRQTDDVLSLIAADPLTLRRLGTHPDSVSRFIDLLEQFTLPPLLAARAGRRVADDGSALLRLDYNVTDAHTLMLRGDWRLSTQEPSRISPNSVPHSGGDSRGSGQGRMLQLTSTFGGFINELRAYGSRERRDVTSYLNVPDGRVLVASVLGDGTRSVSTLTFGGNPSLPQQTRSTLLEVSDEVSFLSRRGGHRYKLGGLLNEERTYVAFIPNRWGTFTFNSLEEFEAGEASMFTRTLLAGDRRSATRNMAIYVGDAWRRSTALQLVYGLRLEGSRYPDAPEHNPQVEAVFGRRTDRFPSDVHLSPRAGFTYNIFPEIGGPPTLTIRGGAGGFRGRAPSHLFAAARTATGLVDGQSGLTCTGEGVPVPDWQAYRLDYGAIPVSCAAGLPGVPTGQRRDVMVFDPSFGAPKAWRASLGVTRRIAEQYTLNVDASYARGVSLTGSRDVNLDTVPEFSLRSEAGRPVYVAPGSIIPATGATSLNASRAHGDFGLVSEVMSELSSDTRQLTTSFNGLLFRGVQFNLSYTFTTSRDQAQGFSSPSLGSFDGGTFIGAGFGGGGGGGTSGGNPNRAAWGMSDIARRHSMLGYVSYRFRPWLDVTGIARTVSGSRFSPLVGGDINGDGVRNDRAFVFDPADPATVADTSLANGMSRLLESGPDPARDCLRSQLGTIAQRNSCAGPWTPSLDLQLNFRPAAFGLSRLTISVLALNVLAGIDQLLHSTGNLRGWGQPAFLDRTLLYVRGFDPASQAYRYDVNENFGGTNRRGDVRVPFQIALQARTTLGADQVQAQFRRAVAGGTAAGPAAADAIRQRMARTIPNAFRAILEIADSAQLNLTDEQQARLAAASDTFQVRADTLVGTIAALLSELSAERSPDPGRFAAQLQPRVREGRQIAVQAVREAQQILTPEQWGRVPEAIRQPFRPREGGPGFMFMGPP